MPHIVPQEASGWLEAAESDGLSPERLGFDLIQCDVMQEITNMVKQDIDVNNDGSFAILDIGIIIKRFQYWKKCFEKIQPFYAVKACNDPVVINLLAYLGAGFSCATKGEIEMVLKLGVDPRRIIFANPVKSPSQLKFATSRGVDVMVFDSKEELAKMKKEAPNARALLRLGAPNLDGSQETATNKFGCPVEDVRELLQEAQRLGISVDGVSFEAGDEAGEAGEARDYIANISAAREVFNIAAEEGFEMRLLDIGGGFIGGVGSEKNLKMISNPVVHTLECLFTKKSGVRIISQPGRYFVEAALTMAMCVIGKRTISKVIQQEDEENLPESDLTSESRGESPTPYSEVCNSFEYFISESKYGPLSIHRECTGHDYKPVSLKKHNTETFNTKLWGASSDSSDVIQERCYLPELKLGDWLAVQNVGAYTLTKACTYNGIPVCPVRRVVNGKLWAKFNAGQSDCK